MKNSWYDYVILKDQKILMMLVVLSIGFSSFLGYLTPQLIAKLYDSYEGVSKFDVIFTQLAALFIAEYVNQVIYQLSINRYIQQMIQHVRMKSYSRWLLSYESISKGGGHKYPLGEVLARLVSDTESLMELVGSGSFKIFIDFAFIISCLISFLTLNKVSGVALISAEVFACILLIIGSRSMAKIYMAVRKSTGHMARALSNLSGGVRYTFFTPNNRFASSRSLGAFEDFLTKQLQANVWDSSYFSIAESLFPLLLGLLVLVFPYSQIVEVAIFAAIIDLIQRSIAPIKDVASKISSIQRARTGLIRIQEFNSDLLGTPASTLNDSNEELAFQKLKVQIRNFEYPVRDGDSSFKLQDISFEGNSGELVGIVGMSGSGKSTVLKILATDILASDSLIEIQSKNKKILSFHGDDIKGISHYKRQVSIVSQDSHVFSESLKFNITMGFESDRFANFWDDVKANIPYLEHWGYELDDHINPKELSMGQKQLISALRSCYLVKPIVLFDEISSGLDSELELALRKLVLYIQKHALTIIVAHRIETIVKADKILVMDQGRLQAIGSHEELLENSAVYQSFVSQIKGLN